jgi:hypothetical protein
MSVSVPLKNSYTITNSSLVISGTILSFLMLTNISAFYLGKGSSPTYNVSYSEKPSQPPTLTNQNLYDEQVLKTPPLSIDIQNLPEGLTLLNSQ